MYLSGISTVVTVCVLLPGLLLAGAETVRVTVDERTTEATLGQLPYLISVWKEWQGMDNTTHTNFYCTGTLVHAEYVLTSYSCAEKASRGGGRVLAAGGHLSIADDPTDIEFHVMSGWIPHEEYDSFERVNNIALIKVSPPFVESANIKVASVRSTLPAENTECTISGWRENYSETSTVLKTAQVRVLAKTECKYLWEEDAKYPQQLCAGIPKSEAAVCNVGDEGGPLFCEFALAGLYVDNDIAVCITGEPNAYLDAAVFSEWVASNLVQGITTSTTPVPTSSVSTEEVTSTTVSVTTSTVSSTEGTESSTEATLGQLPYLISVWKEWTGLDNTTHTDFICTGTLVHTEYVLTSYSCAEGALRGDGRVLAAGGHLSIADDPTDIEFHVMSGWIPHEEYDSFERVNNIALIKVSPPFVESANIKVASVRSTLPTENTECTISGWRENYFETSTVLKTAQVRVLAKTECKYLWEEDARYPQQLCAGIPKSEAAVCNVGDEGGPLFCEFALAGLYVDNDIAVCITGEPNAYLDAAVFSEWVATNLVQGITTSTTPLSTSPTSTEEVSITTVSVTTSTVGSTEGAESATEATLGQLPYLISVWKEWKGMDNTTHTNFLCTGTLVHTEYVLTSYSCAEAASRGDGRVLAAGGHLSIADDSTDIEFHVMSGWILHEEYDLLSRLNNIALIKVSPPFVESANIKVASVRSTLPAENTECTISGWRENYSETSAVLKTAQVRVLAKTECKYMWEQDAKYPQQVCAGIPTSEAAICNVGDEGGPLFCEFALAGLYADNDIAVCFSGNPNAYLDAAVFSEWVTTNLAQGITVSSTTLSTPATSSESVASTTEGMVFDHTTGVIYHSGAHQVSAPLAALLLAFVCLFGHL